MNTEISLSGVSNFFFQELKEGTHSPGTMGDQPYFLSSHLKSFLGKEDWSTALCPSGRRGAPKLSFLFPIFHPRESLK